MKLRVDLKLQHRISRSHSSSRYLENANSQNVFMWQYLYGIAEVVVQRCSEKFRKIYRKTSVLKSLLVKLQARDLHRYKTETPAQAFSSEFARFFRTPILYGLKTLYSRLQIYWYWIDCKSVFKILGLPTEIHFSTDLALMSIHPTYWRW